MLRSIPSVDSLLKTVDDLILRFGRPLTTRAIRTVIDEIRTALQNGELADTKNVNFHAEILLKLESWVSLPIKTVINATGVVIHTNLGRSPLSTDTLQAMNTIACNYNTLEFDLSSGKRGHRDGHVEAVLQLITGAEAGFVVNNCASAVLLALSALAKAKHVIIPRSQLVEIGGGFRVPDVMKQSGAKLLEVGTTNKVRLSDYEAAFEENKKPENIIAMRAHRSNFKIIGFTEEPSLEDTVKLTHQYGSIFIDDLGSGALIPTEQYSLAHEPTVQESINAGADLVMFSGDKLIGGPQAGIIVGKKILIDKLRKHPLARVVRADKTTIAGVHATLVHYLKDEYEQKIPIWRSINRTPEDLKPRAETLIQAIGMGKLIEGFSAVGGGSLPGETLPTWLVGIRVVNPNKFLKNLRNFASPLVARVENDLVIIDLRTVEPIDDALVAKIINTLKVKQ